MRTMKFLGTMGMAFMALLMIASCESSDKKFGYDGETTVYFSNAGYDRVVELGEDPEADLTNDNNHIINIMAYCAGGYDNGNNVTVDYLIDPALCEGYKINGADIDVMPDNYYEIKNPKQFTIAKGSLMGGVQVKLTDAFFEDSKAWESGYVIPVQLVKATGVDKIIDSQSMTFCRVKFVNPWTAVYLRKGKDVINGQTAYRSYQYIEKAELVNIVTKGLNKTQLTVAIKDAGGTAHNVNLLMTFNGDDCTISSNTEGVTATGSGKFVKKDQLMGEFKRNTLYLNYQMEGSAFGKVETTDTLVVRNRGVQKITFTPEK